jgi:NTE family protein
VPSRHPRTLGEWLDEGPYALALSSGFFGFFAHAGMLASVLEAGPPPSRTSGASAGALVAASHAGGVAPDSLVDELVRLRREDFWDPSPGLGLLRGRLFRERLEGLLPRHFSECETPVAVSVHDVLGRKPVALRAGDLPAAVHASCAVPLMFHPVRIGGRIFIDGGVSDRPGLVAMAEGRVLFHHLGSRSPWRRRGTPALALPQRQGLVSLIIEGLPRVNPFALDAGREALELARRATRRALDTPIGPGGIVRVRA